MKLRAKILLNRPNAQPNAEYKLSAPKGSASEALLDLRCFTPKQSRSVGSFAIPGHAYHFENPARLSIHALHCSVRQTGMLLCYAVVIVLALAWSFTAIAQTPPETQPPQSSSLKNWDQVELKSGGVLAGRIVHQGVKDDSGKKSYLVFETLTGGRLKFDESQLKSTKTVVDTPEFQAYLEKLQTLADDPVGHREMCTWLESQPRGKTVFAEQINYHLQRIVELDPNDRQARQRLGMVEINGRWITELQNYQARGYVYDRRWVPQTRQRVNQQLEMDENRLGEAKSQFTKWARNLNRNSALLTRELIDILGQHPQMNLVVVEYIREKSPPDDLRLLMLEAVATQKTIEAFGNLVYFAVEDPSQNVRDRVLSLLEQPDYQQFRPQIANVIASNYLPHANNNYVNRAAFMIQSLGDWSNVMPLIDCLQTTHKIANPNPARPGGIAAGPNGLNVGGGSGPAELPRLVNNDACLNTLRRFTKQDFGFDMLQWRRWYAEQITNTSSSLRRDD